ncbi:NADH dehydrogenase [ubiquinone] 1 subunit C1, mitochondrial [Poeciliopsis prolifica]|uniref:NADH dehydrogenase [ubiquinone] 1 subunit C1, mitochondrial n=1 Tax=Poeciliopsis prolifica TaxID=188132 RepID=UPI0024141BDE|nr:NADH dehydrogenase [ubiquinone] 1 subunit C1, mitochondrial [Poeciliopsis prolifica]XP_054879310.1 NADH dehydrogenase [ubiquinone] 1 subunit C1, mitochondrial [Poeciliopsis prolifica]
MTFSRLLSRVVLINRVVKTKVRPTPPHLPSHSGGSRSAFTSSKTDTTKPNWLKVGLAFGTSAFFWGLLFKQHSTDVHEYEVKKGLQ